MRGKAFSLIEILIAMVILSVALFALMIMNSSSNKGSMDAFYDLQAAQLAQEPLEILSAFGYGMLASSTNQLTEYPLNRWVEVSDPKRYSPEAMQFERMIELEPLTEGPAKAIRIKVSVRPKEAERAKKWIPAPSWSCKPWFWKAPGKADDHENAERPHAGFAERVYRF